MASTCGAEIASENVTPRSLVEMHRRFRETCQNPLRHMAEDAVLMQIKLRSENLK